jgi:hypothetical protein
VVGAAGAQLRNRSTSVDKQCEAPVGSETKDWPYLAFQVSLTVALHSAKGPKIDDALQKYCCSRGSSGVYEPVSQIVP